LNSRLPDPPISRQAVFRIALDVLISGLLGGFAAYSESHSRNAALITGVSVGLKALQSRIAPDLDTMNQQRQDTRRRAAQQAIPDPPTEQG